MSHVATIKTEIKDLEAVKALCLERGWTFKEGQQTYAWFGEHVGDYPLPEGITAEDLGKCSHAIGIPGTTWEIGLVHNPKTNGYRLAFDFWGSKGRPIQNAIGDDGGKFLQGYGICKIEREAKSKGWLTTRQHVPNTNKIQVVLAGM